MKIKSASLIALGLIVTSAVANDNLMETPSSVAKDIVQMCKGFALEDGINEEALNDYLLQCVNSELEEQGFKSISELPGEDD